MWWHAENVEVRRRLQNGETLIDLDFRDARNMNLTLTQREEYVVSQRRENGRTLTEVAKELGLSREGATKLERRALEKLRLQRSHSPNYN